MTKESDWATTPSDDDEGLGLGSRMLITGISACIAEMCTLPLDTIKVRLQVSNNDDHGDHHY